MSYVTYVPLTNVGSVFQVLQKSIAEIIELPTSDMDRICAAS